LKDTVSFLSAIMHKGVSWHCKGESLRICPRPSAKCYINGVPKQLATGQSQLLATTWRQSRASYLSPQ